MSIRHTVVSDDSDNLLDSASLLVTDIAATIGRLDSEAFQQLRPGTRNSETVLSEMQRLVQKRHTETASRIERPTLDAFVQTVRQFAQDPNQELRWKP